VPPESTSYVLMYPAKISSLCQTSKCNSLMSVSWHIWEACAILRKFYVAKYNDCPFWIKEHKFLQTIVQYRYIK